MGSATAEWMRTRTSRCFSARWTRTWRWDATRRLRAWERELLCIAVGQRLLDVGCGLGDAALGLAGDLGSNGEVVGVDVSAEMVAGARSRARSARCAVRFAVGTALELSEPEGSFDVVRSERTVQWLADPQRAVTEMVRMLKPGGRLSLIDTDWSSFTLDVGDEELSRSVRDAMRVERRRPANIGRRLADLAEGLGLEVIAQTMATQHWTAWNPDESPHQMAASQCPASPKTSSAPANSTSTTRNGSCPPFTPPPVKAASRWPSPCSLL